MHAHIQSSNTDSMELEECQHNKEYIICGATTQQSKEPERFEAEKEDNRIEIEEPAREW